MAIDFYYGSGSPFAWTVWLALECKRVPYVAHRLSFDGDDLRSPAFLAINARGQVPAIVDDGFALAESSAIVEYLDDRYPERPLFPADPRARAIVRRLICESHAYLGERAADLLGPTLFSRQAGPDEEIEAARDAMAEECARFERYLAGDWFVGDLSAADLTIYPHLRIVERLGERHPEHGTAGVVPARLTAFLRRVEALPGYASTVPPHCQ